MGHLPDASAAVASARCLHHREVHDMANVEFTLETAVPARAVLAAAVDFGDRRTALWPTIPPEIYRVHDLGDRSAEVTEGSRFLGTIWARERYDWSEAGVVRATIVDSNVFRPGGTWELRVNEADGRTRIRVRSRRQARGLRGRILGTMLAVAGPAILAANFRLTLDVLASGSTLGEPAR
jgi:hypothetical protein